VNVNKHDTKPGEYKNSFIIEDHPTTRVYVIDNRQAENNEEDRNDMDNTPTRSTKNSAFISENVMPTNKIDESPIPPESTFSESPNESNPIIEEQSSRIVNDEQQQNATSYQVTDDVSIYSSQSYTTDSSFVSHDAADDAPHFNSTMGTIDSVSAGEDEAYSTSSPEISRTTQLPMENLSVVDDPDETSTIETSNLAETTQRILENEQSSIISTTETYNDPSHSVMSAISATEYSANTNTSTNVDIATTDTSLFSSVYTSQPELDKETYANIATTSRYDNADLMISDSSAETINQGPISNNISTIMSDLNDYSNISSSTLTPNVMFLGPIADVEQHTTENALTFETSASPE